MLELPWFESRRAEQLRRLEHVNPAMAEFVKELDALYLFGTIGMEAVLRRDGSVLVCVDDEWHAPEQAAPPWRAATTSERTASFVIAKRRIPELAGLLPSRPRNAVDCAWCRGTGSFGEHVVCMNCGALGWVGGAA